MNIAGQAVTPRATRRAGNNRRAEQPSAGALDEERRHNESMAFHRKTRRTKPGSPWWRTGTPLRSPTSAENWHRNLARGGVCRPASASSTPTSTRCSIAVSRGARIRLDRGVLDRNLARASRQQAAKDASFPVPSRCRIGSRSPGNLGRRRLSVVRTSTSTRHRAIPGHLRPSRNSAQSACGVRALSVRWRT